MCWAGSLQAGTHRKGYAEAAVVAALLSLRCSQLLDQPFGGLQHLHSHSRHLQDWPDPHKGSYEVSQMLPTQERVLTASERVAFREAIFSEGRET